jgi:hypothetical protein
MDNSPAIEESHGQGLSGDEGLDPVHIDSQNSDGALPARAQLKRIPLRPWPAKVVGSGRHFPGCLAKSRKQMKGGKVNRMPPSFVMMGDANRTKTEKSTSGIGGHAYQASWGEGEHPQWGSERPNSVKRSQWGGLRDGQSLCLVIDTILGRPLLLFFGSDSVPRRPVIGRLPSTGCRVAGGYE